MKSRTFVVVLVMFLAIVGGISQNVSAGDQPNAVFSIPAPADEVFAAALTTLAGMDFEIKTANEKAGLVVGEHKLVEWNFRVTLFIKKSGDSTTIEVIAKRRKFTLKGGSPEERIAQLKEGFEKFLSKTVTVETEK